MMYNKGKPAKPIRWDKVAVAKQKLANEEYMNTAIHCLADRVTEMLLSTNNQQLEKHYQNGWEYFINPDGTYTTRKRNDETC